MIILILSDIPYLQKVAFSFEEGSNGQNHCSLDSHHSKKKPPSNIFDPALERGNTFMLQ